MKLAVAQLAPGDSSFRFSSRQDSWVHDIVQSVTEEGYQLKSDMEIDLRITKSSPDYYLRGNLGFQVEQICARCAEPFPLKLNHRFDVAMAVMPQGQAGSRAIREESDELDIHFFEGDEIDLSPILREQFFLSLPYQSFCDPECKGVCQRCGANRNREGCSCTESTTPTPFSVLGRVRN